jgi:hypothetical protein
MNQAAEPELDIALFRLSDTGRDGVHSCQPRIKVECLTCNEIVHRGTTDPEAWSRMHFDLKHKTMQGLT